MKKIKTFKIFLEENNPNTPQGYLNSLTKKTKLKPNTSQSKTTDEVDNILRDTEEQKKNVIAKKDAIEKGLLNNIRDLEPENQEDVKGQVKDYKTQTVEFDRTVKQIDKLNKELKKSNRPQVSNQEQKARQQNNL